ncbi:DIS3-like exonuclease 2 isoform X2 [Physella acuta]|uniref:DIS3-like exonuclease 2 isoform X2 n=1 Tax=Physella acuta TaxID=109671 RepID=UPI0027DC6C31|nr:DIS3-like exonuclease 2 isoform X2 [Physella acuta]
MAQPVLKGQMAQPALEEQTVRPTLIQQVTQPLLGGHTPDLMQREQMALLKENEEIPAISGMIYDSYWSEEDVKNGIKRGELIVGPLRINPKNYEDAYVPMPDGSADIFIGGMKDRNRALNLDEVVVQVYHYEKWRVFVDDFENYERSVAEERLVVEESDEDSGPDAIVESDGDEGNNLALALSDKLDISEGTPGAAGKFQDKSPQRSNKNKAQTTPSQGSSKGTPMKKISSVSDMRHSGSPLAKNLFGTNPNGSEAPDSELGNRFTQRTGRVVYIYEKKHSRAASGRLKLMPDKNKNLALFSPTDSRIPRILIPMSECPKDFYQRPEDFSQTLFIARILQWDETSKMPKGTLARSLGEAGEIEPETSALLIELDIDDSPFSDKVIQCLPTNLPWTIPDSEYAYRKDLRSSCIFTIDPATARDLDDAVSIEDLGGGKYQVGVHIADVSYFVKEDTELDMVASRRATSVYLVQKVVPMLPRLLCEQLCSLNPDEDRLTFSVIWTLNEKGEIFDEWYGRSVIRSCVKLSYEHAQGFIEDPGRQWRDDELPPITNSFTASDIVTKVLLLNKIAVNLRKQRFDNGALRLDQVKLQFALNKESGLPNGYSVYQQKDSNRLIEEFMLLANMAVAHKIKTSFPDTAILRRHPPPQVKPLEAVEELCESFGLKIDAATAGDLQKSLLKYHKEDDFSLARIQVLVVLISKPMQNAKYFCSGAIPDENMYHHYALNVPLYTHFTSPIRRYPDILVHRLLAAALDYCEPPKRSIQVLQRQAEHCNDKKQTAKMASERSNEMFFSLFVKEAGPLEESGMVMAVLDKSFDVLVLKLGVVKRVYLERLPLASSQYHKNSKCPELLLEWKPDESCHRSTRHKITLFSIVECCLASDKEPLKWSCIIKRPKDEISYMDAGHD